MSRKEIIMSKVDYVKYELEDTNGDLIGSSVDYVAIEEEVNQLSREDFSNEFRIYGITEDNRRIRLD